MLCGALPSRLKSCRACPALIVRDPEDSQTAREHNFPVPRVAEIAARAAPTQIQLSVAALDVEHEYDHEEEEWKRETVLVQEDLTDSRVVGQEEDALHVSNPRFLTLAMGSLSSRRVGTVSLFVFLADILNLQDELYELTMD